MEEVDIVVLGLGTGGEDLALQLLDAGVEVAGIEPQLVGGECPYWACIPSKMAIRAANLLTEARRVDGVAGEAQVNPDWTHVATRIRSEASGGWDDTAAVARFQSRGGRFVRGRGRLTGPRTVAAGEHTFSTRRGVVIATGSRPAVPPVPGLDTVDYWTTHEAIAAETLPASILVLGGGAVGCELAQVFSRFGTHVSVVEGRARLLSQEEPEASEHLASVFEEEGIDLHLGVRVATAEQVGDEIRLTLEDGTVLAGERVLVAAGRTVVLTELGLEEVGLDPGADHIEVDERMRAGDGLWALGDVTGKAMFTHVALHQSAVAAADILGGEPDPIDYQSLPRVTFTDPEIGAVGLTEEQARARGLEVEVALKRVPSTFRGWLHDTGQGGVIKLVVDPRAGILLGGTVAAPGGGEVLGLLNLAVHEGTSLEALRAMTYPFPSLHGGIGEALGAYARGSGTVIDPTYAASAYLD